MNSGKQWLSGSKGMVVGMNKNVIENEGERMKKCYLFVEPVHYNNTVVLILTHYRVHIELH